MAVTDAAPEGTGLGDEAPVGHRHRWLGDGSSDEFRYHLEESLSDSPAEGRPSAGVGSGDYSWVASNVRLYCTLPT